jgi:hypothetical protein
MAGRNRIQHPSRLRPRQGALFIRFVTEMAGFAAFSFIESAMSEKLKELH